MLDHFIIFSLQGVVLWYLDVAGDGTSEAANVTLCALVGEKLCGAGVGVGASTMHVMGGTTVRWLAMPRNGIIFSALFATVVAQHTTAYVDELLRGVSAAWCERFDGVAALRGVEVGASPEDVIAVGAGALVAEATFEGVEAFPFLADFERLLEAAERYPVIMGNAGASPSNAVKCKEGTPASAKDGGSRQWTLSSADSAALARRLDRSRPPTTSEKDRALQEQQRFAFVFSGRGTGARDLDDDDDDGAVAPGSNTTAALSWLARAGSRVGALFAGLLSEAAPRNLAPTEVEALLAAVKEKLASANVSNDVAEALIARVAEGLVGRKFANAADTSAAIYEALGAALERVLSPRPLPDLVRDAKAKSAAAVAAGIPLDKRAPFIVVFCGVNGVGKSTTLAKIAYMLKDAGLTVSVAACDSFRSGAVEQLKRHTTALDIPLFEQGYARDPVAIARGAIQAATKAGTQVVLVDTAGRMQNNKELMAQLARLVAAHSPDAVLFVGEALVGHDGADQLLSFDGVLTDFIGGKRERRIDGIILTKFDAVDNKVGTAVSMVYKTGIPVAFVGVGQTYTDLRRLNVRAVVHALLH